MVKFCTNTSGSAGSINNLNSNKYLGFLQFRINKKSLYMSEGMYEHVCMYVL